MSDFTRRDFLNGAALAIVGAATPRELLARQAAAAGYPPGLSGLRGQTDAAFAAAHGMAMQGKRYRVGGLPVEETYDLVVVGGGISGLAAAWFYRKKHGAQARILILDALEDFGGHAKRNEFEAGGRLLVGYGGSEALQSPKANFSDTVNGLLRSLGVDVAKFESSYFKATTYPDLGLSRASFFDRDAYGRDTLVTGDPTDWVSDDIPRERRNGRALEKFIGDFPLPEAARAQLLELYTSKRVTLGHLDDDAAREAYLWRTSYVDFLRQDWGLSDEAIGYFRNRPLDFFGLGPGYITALDAGLYAYPGLQGIALPSDPEAAGELEEPYVYHFPDGNASVARLLVRALVPGVAPGNTMEDIVTARFDYSKLDLAGSATRLRLDSTVVRVVNGAGGVEIGYIPQSDGRLHRIRSRHCVLACFNMLIPYILGDLPAAQAAALRENVKSPLVYSNAVIRNWEPWVKLGVHEIYGVSSFHCRVKLDYPVSMGSYAFPSDPAQPMVVHMVHVPVVDGLGKDVRKALRAARATLLDTPFAAYEAAVRKDLSRMLGPGGFDADRDLLALTVNRWSHGYAWGVNGLCDDEDTYEDTIALACKPVGKVAIANADAAWSAYAHSAIDEAYRAVGELG